MTTKLIKGNNIIEVPLNADNEITFNSINELDTLVTQTGATYKISYSSHKRGTIHLPNGTTEQWTIEKH